MPAVRSGWADAVDEVVPEPAVGASRRFLPGRVIAVSGSPLESAASCGLGHRGR